MKLPFKVDLSSKVVAITGAGGVICGEFSKALAACGAKVALLDVNFESGKENCRRNRGKRDRGQVQLPGQEQHR